MELLYLVNFQLTNNDPQSKFLHFIGAPLLSRDSMDGQNMAYTADNGGGYDQSYDANVDSNVAGSENYQLEDQTQYDRGADIEYALDEKFDFVYSALKSNLCKSQILAIFLPVRSHFE